MFKDPLVKIILFLVLAGCIIIFWGLIERGMRKGAEYDKERAETAQAVAEANVAVSVGNQETLQEHVEHVDDATSAYIADMQTISDAVDVANTAFAAAQNGAVDDSVDSYDRRRAIVCGVCYDAWTAICGPYMPAAPASGVVD